MLGFTLCDKYCIKSHDGEDLNHLLFQIEGEGKEAKISLTPLQSFARDLLTVLHEAGGRMLLINFDTAYLDRFGKLFVSHFFFVRSTRSPSTLISWSLKSPPEKYLLRMDIGFLCFIKCSNCVPID